jgi:hypothetical protein
MTTQEKENRRIFIEYAREIIKNLRANYSPQYTLTEKQEHGHVKGWTRKVLLTMATGESDINYTRLSSLMPKDYDKALMEGTTGNSYQGPFLSLTDDKHDTIINQALIKEGPYA